MSSTPNDLPKKTKKRALAVTAFAWWGFLAVVFAYAVHGSMDIDNPVKLPLEKELYTVAYLPEGWKFFTRNAREDVTLIYEKNDSGHWVRADNGTNSSKKNLFGLSRRGRNEHIELGIIMSGIPQAAYEQCTLDADSCLGARAPRMKIQNYATRPGYCGTVGIVTSQRVPWAWANSPEPPTMSSKVTVVEVSC
jgi:antimicrobial peptide system SdpA family protein